MARVNENLLTEEYTRSYTWTGGILF